MDTLSDTIRGKRLASLLSCGTSKADELSPSRNFTFEQMNGRLVEDAADMRRIREQTRG